jgi:hypothetical protein
VKTRLGSRDWGLALTFLVCGVLTLPGAASAACCRLVKVEPQPTQTHVRVCDESAGPACAQPHYDGNVRFGSPVNFCTDTDQVTYQELNSATGSYGAPISARCDATYNVEL